jgi:hypothetical protein
LQAVSGRFPTIGFVGSVGALLEQREVRLGQLMTEQDAQKREPAILTAFLLKESLR